MLGEKIKTMRKRIGLTLKDMSQRTNLSVGYLSNIERNTTSPTIDNLQLICNVFRVSIVDILKEEERKNPLVRKEERKIISVNSKGSTEAMTDFNHSIFGVCLTMDKNITEETVLWYGNQYDQFGIVIKGVFEMTIEGKSYICHEGDTIFIDANVTHRFRKINEGECITYWCIAKSSYKEPEEKST